MSRDNAPTGNTCPMIDNVIDCINTVTNELDWLIRNQDSEEAIMGEIGNSCDSMLCINDAKSVMEDIRSANAELREWGNGLYDEREDLYQKVDDLTNDLEYANEQISYLREEVSSLEAELETEDH